LSHSFPSTHTPTCPGYACNLHSLVNDASFLEWQLRGNERGSVVKVRRSITCASLASISTSILTSIGREVTSVLCTQVSLKPAVLNRTYRTHTLSVWMATITISEWARQRLGSDLSRLT
jgi:hypothetical protein